METKRRAYNTIRRKRYDEDNTKMFKPNAERSISKFKDYEDYQYSSDNDPGEKVVQSQRDASKIAVVDENEVEGRDVWCREIFEKYNQTCKETNETGNID